MIIIRAVTQSLVLVRMRLYLLALDTIDISFLVNSNFVDYKKNYFAEIWIN